MPLSFSTWSGTAEIVNGSVVLRNGVMKSGAQSYETTGSATFARELDLRFRAADSEWTVSGPLARPKVDFQPRRAMGAAETASNRTNAAKVKD